jgi:hypothetical protein
MMFFREATLTLQVATGLRLLVWLVTGV